MRRGRRVVLGKGSVWVQEGRFDFRLNKPGLSIELRGKTDYPEAEDGWHEWMPVRLVAEILPDGRRGKK